MKAWEITKKDLKLLVRDRRALAVLVILPLIFITIIGMTTGKLLGWSDTNKVLKIAIVDEIDYEQIGTAEFFEDEFKSDQIEEVDDEFDEFEPVEFDEEQKAQHQKIAANLFAKLSYALQTRDGLAVLHVDTGEKARKMYVGGDANVALIVGKDFYKRIHKLEPRDLALSAEGRLSGGLDGLDMKVESRDEGSSTHAIIELIALSQTMKAISPVVLCGSNYLRPRFGTTCEELDQELDGPPIELVPVQPVVQGESEVYQELIPSYTVMFVFFLVNVMARSFIHERDLGTLRRLVIAPIGPTSLLAGKTVPFLIISLAQTALLFLCGKLLFGMSWGPMPWLLLPVIFCTSMAATALGLLVATVVRTEAQVSAVANLVVITMAGISGCFMPRKWLPEAMQQVSLATPHAWALIAYKELLAEKVPNTEQVWICCAWLTGFALLYFVIGVLRFDRTE